MRSIDTQKFSMDMGNKPPGQENPDGETLLKEKPSQVRPPRYSIYLHNDDYTPMDFVIRILQIFFLKTFEEANDIMMKVHSEGVGLCGVYSFEVAETKVHLVMKYAKKHQYPLQCSMQRK